MRLLASEGLSFFVKSLSYFGEILELFSELNNFLSNSVKMEQKQHEITLFLPLYGIFANKNDFKSVTPVKNSNFAVLFLDFFLLHFCISLICLEGKIMIL